MKSASFFRAVKSFHKRHILSTDQFSPLDLEVILKVAEAMEFYMQTHRVPPILKSNIVSTLFFEPSTRTRLSFETAMFRLGGQVVTVEQGNSTSAEKGESLRDMGRIISNYADVIVMRHPHVHSVQELASTATVPVINAGDGSNEHPTQAFQDLYTIYHAQKRLETISIALVGDLKYGRTIHSLLRLLVQYPIKIYLAAHPELHMTSEQVAQYSNHHAEVQQIDTDELKALVPDLDVLYMTRIQKERFVDPTLYEKVHTSFILTKALLEKAKDTLSILHPLPKVKEIAIELDDDPRATYFRQAKNGIYVRMALLALSLGRVDETLLEVVS